MRRDLEGKPTIPVTDCFADTRLGWFDGGRLECPFCWSVSEGRTCQNPACPASPWATPAVFVDICHAEALREEEGRRRRAIHEWSMQRIAGENAARDALRVSVAEEAKARGACVPCALDSVRYAAQSVKYTRHRNGCPKGTGVTKEAAQ